MSGFSLILKNLAFLLTLRHNFSLFPGIIIYSSSSLKGIFFISHNLFLSTLIFSVNFTIPLSLINNNPVLLCAILKNPFGNLIIFHF